MTKKQTTILSISTEPEFPDQLVWNLIKEDGNSITGIAPNLKLALEAITSTITKREHPSDENLLSLIPQSMRDDFAEASKVLAESVGLKPGIFRVLLNTQALDYAKVVLDRYGNLPIEPVSVSKCLPEPKDLHPTEGWAWFCNKSSDWRNLLPPTKDPSDPMYWFPYTHWLPYWAIPYVKNESH